MENIYRNTYCGEVTKEYVGKEIKLAGWIDTIRNLGSLAFITLRDETGIVQLISSDVQKYSEINRESTVTVIGKVNLRSEGMSNKNMKTGEVEIEIIELKVLGEMLKPLPFEIKTSKEATEDTRLKYRFLDLRNPLVHENILFRSKVISFIREVMTSMGFTEIQTPILTADSPEGARCYVVPSRKFKGKFYALPQAPQMFKQLLMVSGFNRYFQIAPCFRDEDPRSDRLVGDFYQVDMEMSFATQEDVYAVAEKLFYEVFTKFSDKEVSTVPFRRIPYKVSMETYGTDKPDLRNPLVLTNLTEILEKSDFEPFKNTTIAGIVVPSVEKSNSWYAEIEKFAKQIELKGISYIKVNEDMSFKSSLSKYINEEVKEELVKELNLKPGNIIFIIADKESAYKKAGLVRNKLGIELELVDKNKFEFCIINDFPMYEYNEDTKGYDFTHNPFSMPQGGMDSLMNKKPDEILAFQYDFVCNGIELCSGGERNHRPDMLVKAFELAGYKEEDIKKRFTALYDAFHYGAPPHAGMAPGVDRILMMLKDEPNVREVVAFPISGTGQDMLMGCPSELTEQQLRELHLKIRD